MLSALPNVFQILEAGARLGLAVLTKVRIVVASGKECIDYYSDRSAFIFNRRCSHFRHDVNVLWTSMTVDRRHPLSDYRIFSAHQDSTLKLLLESWEELFSSKVGKSSAGDTGGEMRMRHNKECLLWRSVFNRARRLMSGFSTEPTIASKL